jgi:hypothetical protein
MGDWSVMKDQAIYNTHPSVVEIIESKDCFDVDGNSVILDESKIATELTKLQSAYDSKQYSRDRAEAYASIPDQLDYIYHNGVDAWKENMILPIKNKYPKEIS